MNCAKTYVDRQSSRFETVLIRVLYLRNMSPVFSSEILSFPLKHLKRNVYSIFENQSKVYRDLMI